MAKSVVTLYLDDSRLQLLETKGAQIKKWADCQLDPGLVKDGAVANQAEVSAKIVYLTKAQKIRAKKVILGLSGLHCFFRVLTLPDVSGQLLESAVKLEAEKLIPIPLEQLYISWQIIARQGTEIKTFLAALPRSMVDSTVGAVREAGLDPYLVDLKPLALSRVADRSTAIITDLQPTELNIVVMVDRVPQLARTVSLDKTLSRDDKLALIKEELERTIKFYNSSQSKNPLDSEVPVLVSGIIAEGLDLIKAANLKHPVLEMESPLKSPEGFPAGHYLVNIGLALKESRLRRKDNASVVNINALPPELRPKPIPWVQVGGIAGGAVSFALLVPMFMMVNNTTASTSALQASLDAKRLVVASRQKDVAAQRQEINTLETNLQALQSNSAKLKSLSQSFSTGHELVNGDLSTIWGDVLGEVNISSIDYSATKVTLEGKATTEDAALAYGLRLRESGRFSGVSVSFIGDEQDKIGFSLTLSE